MKLYTLTISFALLALAACSENLFGSSSGNNNCGNDIKCLRIDAENAFRKGEYETSYNRCKEIVEIDPATSFGYYGMAKAGLWQHGVNPLSIFSLVKPKDDECPFMGEDVKVQNNYFQAMKKVVSALSELNRRDSLTEIYEFYMQARENGKRLDDSLSRFRDAFCNAQGCRDTTNKREPFPLSDREYKKSYFGGILLLSIFSKWFLNFFDMSGDGCLTREKGKNGEKGIPGIDNPGDPIKNASKWEEWGCKKDPSFGFDYDSPLLVKCPRDEEGNMQVVIDPVQILDALLDVLNTYFEREANCQSDCENIPLPHGIGNLNDKIDSFSDDFKEVEEVLNGLGFGVSEDSTANLKEEIDKYKAYASFYKVGTHYDQDGDGCIDEELLDGQDNDGDGLVNENSRLAPTDPNDRYYGISSMNNSMYGSSRYKNAENWEYNRPWRLPPPVKIYNSPDYLTFTELSPDSTGLITVMGFTQLGYPDGKRYWTTTDMDLKLKVAQDANCLEYNLDRRKRIIGGCWPYYDENKFRDFCNWSRN